MKKPKQFDAASIARLRLSSQLLTGTRLTTAKESIAWMGAMQAQDFPMATWAVGIRLPGSTQDAVEAALNQGQILRTHLLRPTWHFVAAEDIYWMLELTRERVKTAQGSRERALGLDQTIFSKSRAILEKALRDGRHLGRDALVVELNKAGIATDQNRASHLFARAELDMVICSGELQRGKPTYALLSERVPRVRQLTRDEALAELSIRYFTSRCPATLLDFTWWSGLTAGEARKGLELAKSHLHAEEVGGCTYWCTDNFSLTDQMEASVHFLPAYDEFTLSYSDRSASIPAALEQYMRVISDRGIFRPVIELNGQVIGVWKRTINKRDVTIEINLFTPVEKPMMGMLDRALENYGSFMQRNAILKV